VGVFPPHPITNARNSTTAKRMGVLCTNAALIDSCPDFTQFYIKRRHLALLVFTRRIRDRAAAASPRARAPFNGCRHQSRLTTYPKQPAEIAPNRRWRIANR
jgi:hypothetical protein